MLGQDRGTMKRRLQTSLSFCPSSSLPPALTTARPALEILAAKVSSAGLRKGRVFCIQVAAHPLRGALDGMQDRGSQCVVHNGGMASTRQVVQPVGEVALLLKRPAAKHDTADPDWNSAIMPLVCKPA